MTLSLLQQSFDPRRKSLAIVLLSSLVLIVIGVGLVLQLVEVSPEEVTDGRGMLSDPGEDQKSEYTRQRQGMVEQQLRSRDILDPRVLAAMGKVPRHLFVPVVLRVHAYSDRPLPIGYGQTISQPYIVALMTQLARPQPDDRALDVGTGSGYQAAVLAEICKEIYSIEILEPLAASARVRLQAAGYENVVVRHGDGYRGWPEQAPFDVIVVAAAPDHVPRPLIEQLAPGGRLVIPVGQLWQSLRLVVKDDLGNVHQREVKSVAFVPMTGEAERAVKGEE